MEIVNEISRFENTALKAINSNQADCPNCWGRQEYGGTFFEALKTSGIDSKNIDQMKGWIQAYVEKNLIGIVLQVNDKQLVCKQCNTAYLES